MSRPRLTRPVSSLPVAALLTAAVVVLSACADRPDLSGRVAPVDPTLAWPGLLSTATLVPGNEDRDDEAKTETAPGTLDARAAALRARGRALARRPVLSERERDRLFAAIARHDISHDTSHDTGAD